MHQCDSCMRFWTTVEVYGTYQTLDTQAILVSRTSSLLVLIFLWDLLTIKKIQNISWFFL